MGVAYCGEDQVKGEAIICKGKDSTALKAYLVKGEMREMRDL